MYAQFLTISNLQLAQKPGSPESLQQLVEVVKNPAASVAALSGVNVGKDDKARQSKDKKVTGDVIVQLLLIVRIFSSDPKVFSFC